MKYKLFELPVTSLEYAESPSVSSLHAQFNGTLLCGMAFCKPLLFRIHPTENDSIERIEDLKLEETIDGAVAITNGLRSSVSGETAFATLHEGFLPGFLRCLSGPGLSQKKGDELLKYLAAQDGGMGANVRHSIIQMIERSSDKQADKTLMVRRAMEPGAMLDTAHIGDFVFGLLGSYIWREPYLNSEKRETLRGDLAPNFNLHRDDDGNFWLLGQNGRLSRMNQTDIKAKPTPLKFPDISGFFYSAASSTDGWLYGTCQDSKTLVRIRRNLISLEEEIQTVKTFETRISSLCSIDREENSVLLIATEADSGAELYTLSLIKPEDPEMLPPVPEVKSLSKIRELKCVSSLTRDLKMTDKTVVWGGEGRLGCGVVQNQKPRILRISEL